MNEDRLGAEDEFTVGRLVGRLAGLLRGDGSLSKGDVAQLRRMDPRQPVPAFFKTAGMVLDPVLPGEVRSRTDSETRWAAVIAGLAILGPLHQHGLRLGTVLATADYSELRFVRLIRSGAEQLVDELPSLARFMTAKQSPVDWTAAADLVLSAGRTTEDAVRRHIARDYYGSLARLERGAATGE
jgi:CRISPR type I-E-associated protein CasB/Cse2